MISKDVAASFVVIMQAVQSGQLGSKALDVIIERLALEYNLEVKDGRRERADPQES